MFDVHIIGAGPAGCVAAISAARAGYNVLVSEEHPATGGKPCSGLFSKSGLETLRDYLDWKEAVEKEIYGAELHLGNSVLTVKKRGPIAYACNRSEFDKLLACSAEREGVKIRYGERITKKFCANRIIGADGVFSSVASFFGFTPLTKFVATLQGNVNADWDKDIVKVFLSSDFKGFFGWVIPRGSGSFEIGCGIELPGNVDLAFEKLKRRIHVRDVRNVRGYVIPVRTRAESAKRVNGRSVFLVGDAAGQTKATTGGGVIFGAWCASIAGVSTNPFHYEFKWRAKYERELFLHMIARRLLNRLNDDRLTALGRELAENGFEEFLEKNGDMDIISRIIFRLALFPKIPLIFIKNNI
ncbi:MAG: NAD(P)/FAD-dependent oxidoreductase [Candidatus Bilamarchaeaceae archaeon]